MKQTPEILPETSIKADIPMTYGDLDRPPLTDRDIYAALLNSVVKNEGITNSVESTPITSTDEEPPMSKTALSDEDAEKYTQGSLLEQPEVDRRSPRAAEIRAAFDKLTEVLNNPILARWKTEFNTILELAREVDITDNDNAAELAGEISRIQDQVALITSELDLHKETPHIQESEPNYEMSIGQDDAKWLHNKTTDVELDLIKPENGQPYLFGDIVDDSHPTRKAADKLRPSQLKAATKATQKQIEIFLSNPFSTTGLRKLEDCTTTGRTNLDAYKAELSLPDISGCRALVLRTKDSSGAEIFILASVSQHDDQETIIYGL